MRKRKNRLVVRLNDEEYNKLQELKEFTGMDGSRVVRRLLASEMLQRIKVRRCIRSDNKEKGVVP